MQIASPLAQILMDPGWVPESSRSSGIAGDTAVTMKKAVVTAANRAVEGILALSAPRRKDLILLPNLALMALLLDKRPWLVFKIDHFNI